MFAAPVTTRRTHAALHLVEDEKDVIFVANLSQLLQPFATEMIVTALALDRLNDDCAGVDSALVDEVPDLALGHLFPPKHIRLALRFRQRKIDVRTRNARPIEFGKQIRLARIGVRKAHRVTAAPVKSAAEM